MNQTTHYCPYCQDFINEKYAILFVYHSQYKCSYCNNNLSKTDVAIRPRNKIFCKYKNNNKKNIIDKKRKNNNKEKFDPNLLTNEGGSFDFNFNFDF